MREVGLGGPAPSLESATLRACVATILELTLDEVPEPTAGEEPATGWTISRWLGGLGVGLVRVADPGSFAWPGPWIARLARPGAARRFVVMYGVPSGPVWDPGGDGSFESAWIDDGFVLAAADIALARPQAAAAPVAAGVVEAIWVAPAAGEAGRTLAEARAIAGQGLEGDRHVTGTGTFPSGVPGSALTLIEAEVCESFDPPLEPAEHRRNVVTRGADLNGLVGREFSIGGVRCVGRRLCEPCRVLDGYSPRTLLRPLVHRGGLRADILEDGLVRVGDAVRPSSA